MHDRFELAIEVLKKVRWRHNPLTLTWADGKIYATVEDPKCPVCRPLTLPACSDNTDDADLLARGILGDEL